MEEWMDGWMCYLFLRSNFEYFFDIIEGKCLCIISNMNGWMNGRTDGWMDG